jgi:hypothetical protein
MIRLCPLSSRFGANLKTSSMLLAGLLLGASSDSRAADKPGLSYARLKELVAHSIKTGAVTEVAGRTHIEGNSLQVNDAYAVEMMDADLADPYVGAFFDQVAIEFRRQHLLQRQRSKQTIEPYYVKMEGIVAKKLAVIEDKKLSDDDRNTKLQDLSEQMQKIYDEGMQAVAKSLGLAKAEFLAGAASGAHDVQLLATKGATIDLVRQTTAWVLKDAGKVEQDYPWTSYQAGETVPLSGSYFSRIRLNGKQATASKSVGERTTRLEFPDP